MEETIKEISRKTLDELQKANKLPYPLYYKEVFDEIAKERGIEDQLNPALLCSRPDINEQLLETTKKMISNVQSTSQTIKKSSEDIIEKINKTKLKYKNSLIQFSISAGIAFHKKGDDKEILLKKADDALYEAKLTKNTYKYKVEL